MPTQIAAIQARPLDFRTQTNAAWIDGLPVVSQAGAAGVVHGADNVGNGALTVADVAPATSLGAHVVTVTSTQDGLARLTAQDPTGTVTARGVADLPLYADGITFTLATGWVPFQVGDSYAIGVLAQPINLSGLTFALQVRATPANAAIRLAASSVRDGGVVPMIAVGAATGTLALDVPDSVMASLPPGRYVYDLLAADPGLGRTAVVFYGSLLHAAGVTVLA